MFHKGANKPSSSFFLGIHTRGFQACGRPPLGMNDCPSILFLSIAICIFFAFSVCFLLFTLGFVLLFVRLAFIRAIDKGCKGRSPCSYSNIQAHPVGLPGLRTIAGGLPKLHYPLLLESVVAISVVAIPFLDTTQRWQKVALGITRNSFWVAPGSDIAMSAVSLTLRPCPCPQPSHQLLSLA